MSFHDLKILYQNIYCVIFINTLFYVHILNLKNHLCVHSSLIYMTVVTSAVP